MKPLRVFLDGGSQTFKLLLEPSGDFRPSLVFVIAQRATEVLRHERMKDQSHRGATTASRPVLLLPGSSPPQGSDPFQHSCGWPRRGRRHRRRGPLGASPVSGKPGKPGRYRGVSSPPVRCRLAFAHLKITPCSGSGKPIWLLGGSHHPPRGEINAGAIRASAAERSAYRDEEGKRAQSAPLKAIPPRAWPA